MGAALVFLETLTLLSFLTFSEFLVFFVYFDVRIYETRLSCPNQTQQPISRLHRPANRACPKISPAARRKQLFSTAICIVLAFWQQSAIICKTLMAVDGA